MTNENPLRKEEDSMKRILAVFCCGIVMATSYGCQKTEERSDSRREVVSDAESMQQRPIVNDPVLAAIGSAVDDFTTQKETRK